MTVSNDAGACAPANAATRLRVLADRLPALGADGRWLADAITRWMQDEAATLDEALGVTGRARQADKLHRRDVLIRAMRTRFYPSHSVNAAAVAVGALVSRYETTAWRHDQHAVAMPAQYAGTPKEIAYRLMRLGCRMPGSNSKWREILTAHNLSVASQQPFKLATDRQNIEEMERNTNDAA